MTFDEFVDALHAAGWRAPCDAQHEHVRAVWDRLFPPPPLFKVGDAAIWSAGGSWGDIPATILCFSKSGNRIRIRCRPPREKYDHYTYVTQAKLSQPQGEKP